jgi:hypothetical protein
MRRFGYALHSRTHTVPTRLPAAYTDTPSPSSLSLFPSSSPFFLFIYIHIYIFVYLDSTAALPPACTDRRDGRLRPLALHNLPYAFYNVIIIQHNFNLSFSNLSALLCCAGTVLCRWR